MFDILTDVWARPGAAHSPIVPLNISSVTADEAESRVSALHKYGLDSLLLTCDGPFDDNVLSALFSAAAKRYMLVFVHETVITSDMDCDDKAFVSYNPMLRSHTLRLSPASDTVLSEQEELVASYFVKLSDGIIIDAVEETDDTAEYQKYDVILTALGSTLDCLSPEAGNMLLSVYEAFLEKYGDVRGGSFAGIMSSRLTEYSTDRLTWSYDMTDEFFAHGGTPAMLLSLLAQSEKRITKEGRRIFRKTLASRLDGAYLSPVSDWCGKNSLAFSGEIPFDFVGTCARRFTLPVYDENCFNGAVSTTSERMTAVQCLADTARGEGFTGAVYRCTASDISAVVSEAYIAYAASASLILLPEKFSSPEYMESVDIRCEDMKKLTASLRRFSTINTSVSADTSCAVLCDDGFIPFNGAAKLRELGVKFNFLTLSQASDRGHSHGGEFLVDRFRYSSLLIDQRVRMSPHDVKHLGEFAAYGGKMYRGAQFGDFAKKHLNITEFGKECAKVLLTRTSVKCGHLFAFFVNTAAEPVKLNYPYDARRAAYLLDPETGDKHALCWLADSNTYTEHRIPAGGTLTLAWDFDTKAPDLTGAAPTVREIHSLRDGENAFIFKYSAGDKAFIELDSFEGNCVDIEVNGKTVRRILSVPYSIDVTDLMRDGDNTVKLTCGGRIHGAVLRIF